MKTILQTGKKYRVVKEGAYLTITVSSGYCSWELKSQKLKIGDIITFKRKGPVRFSDMMDVAEFEHKGVIGSFSPDSYGNPDMSYLEML